MGFDVNGSKVVLEFDTLDELGQLVVAPLAQP